MPKYDVAVMGAGLGGLAVAALLADRNKKTLILEQSASLSDALGVVEKNGFVFSAGPSLSYGFEPGGALQKFSRTLGITHHTAVLSPCYQVALPDRRITVFADWNETREELKREFPNEIKALSQFYDDLANLSLKISKNRVSAFLARHRSAGGFMSNYGFSHALMSFFDVQSLFFFQKPVVDLRLQSLIRLCISTPRYVRGGFRKFGDQMYGAILQRGGEIRYNEPSLEFVRSEKRIIGIKTAQGVVEADTIILNVVPYQHKTMLLIGLREDVVPVGMSHDVLFLPDYGRPLEFFALSLNDTEDNSGAPKGMRALSVLFLSRQNGLVDKQACVDQLGSLIPFLDEYLVFVEEFKPGAGHAVLPADLRVKPFCTREEAPLLFRTTQKNVFVLHDELDTPLPMIAAVQRHIEKFA